MEMVVFCRLLCGCWGGRKDRKINGASISRSILNTTSLPFGRRRLAAQTSVTIIARPGPDWV